MHNQEYLQVCKAIDVQVRLRMSGMLSFPLHHRLISLRISTNLLSLPLMQTRLGLSLRHLWDFAIYLKFPHGDARHSFLLPLLPSVQSSILYQQLSSACQRLNFDYLVALVHHQIQSLVDLALACHSAIDSHYLRFFDISQFQTDTLNQSIDPGWVVWSLLWHKTSLGLTSQTRFQECLAGQSHQVVLIPFKWI